MEIAAMQQIQPLKLSLDQTSDVNAQQGVITPFQDVFQGVIDDVVSTEKELEQSQYLLATGQIDDAHTVPAAAAKAQLSVDLMIQLRNKAIESYNELMRISL